MSPEPRTWVCNACDHEGATSREHLIHIAVGRVILANWGLSPDEVRQHLQNDHFSQFSYYQDVLHDEPMGRAWLNQEIRGLICRDCNLRWARALEEEAGRNLYDFTELRGSANARVLRRWAWWFAMKLWFMGTRPEGLSAGPLRPVVRKLADPSVAIGLPVLLARISGSPKVWNLAGLAQGWRGAHTPFMAWIIRGVVWIVVASDEPTVTLPIPATPLTEA